MRSVMDEPDTVEYELSPEVKEIFEQSMANIVQHTAACLQGIQGAFVEAMIDQIREHTAEINRKFREDRKNTPPQ